MKLTITISMDNAAFEPGIRTLELHEILTKLGQRIANSPQYLDVYNPDIAPVLDSNGNKVGTATTTND